jgi:hypothetical protein
MNRLVFESWSLLLFVERVMRFRDFGALHDIIRRQAVSLNAPQPVTSAEAICHALDLACVFYVKPVLCLQRSAAATILLRRRGYAAELVIGIQVVPSRSHAWVEIDGRVTNDKPYMQDLYRVLERC